MDEKYQLYLRVLERFQTASKESARFTVYSVILSFCPRNQEKGEEKTEKQRKGKKNKDVLFAKRK